MELLGQLANDLNILGKKIKDWKFDLPNKQNVLCGFKKCYQVSRSSSHGPADGIDKVAVVISMQWRFL